MSSPPSVTTLLRELASAVELSSVTVPPAVGRRYPEIEPLARELGLGVAVRPEGREGLICLIADQTHGDADSISDQTHGDADSIAATLARFEPPPFVLLLPADPTGGSGAEHALAEALLARSGAWLVREQPAEQSGALLAPTARLRGAATLPGEWRAAPACGSAMSSDRETLSALWGAAERDRQTLDEIDSRIRSSATKLDEARRARERLSAEIARLRESERYELDRVRLAVLEERAWVAEQATRLASSSSWRIGHRLVRLGRLLRFKRDRGTNLPEMIAKRMEDAEIR
jgi:hypothetical protein